jgi:ATP-binding cassette subfamily B (MDR/TAP) protein 1
VPLQALLTIKNVKSHNAQRQEYARYARCIEEQQGVGVRKATYEGWAMGSNWLVIFVSYAVAILYGCYLVGNAVTNPVKGRAYTGGDVITVFWSVLVASLTLGDIGPCWAQLSSSRICAHRLFALIDRAPAVGENIHHRKKHGKSRGGGACVESQGRRPVSLPPMHARPASIGPVPHRPSLGLPLGWEMAVDATSGMPYYYHVETGMTQWEQPPRTPPQRSSPHYAAAAAAAVAVGGHIRFTNVHFAYPTYAPGMVPVPVLAGVDLEAMPGQKVALVGPSGHGKSTIIALLQRFYDVAPGGSITVDGVDVRNMDVQEWRSQVAVVTQQPTLLLGTVEHNIRCGNTTATAEDVRRAAEAANAHEFIAQLSEGYNTSVGVGGGLLSGGQKQRICIARAILRRPRLLLLDEATSALDNDNERVVQAALDHLMGQGCAVFVIAHRLSTVMNADRICVIEFGRVVEQGRHAELLRRPHGRYTALVSAQLCNEDSEAGARAGAGAGAAGWCDNPVYNGRNGCSKESKDTGRREDDAKSDGSINDTTNDPLLVRAMDLSRRASEKEGHGDVMGAKADLMAAVELIISADDSGNRDAETQKKRGALAGQLLGRAEGFPDASNETKEGKRGGGSKSVVRMAGKAHSAAARGHGRALSRKASSAYDLLLQNHGKVAAYDDDYEGAARGGRGGARRSQGCCRVLGLATAPNTRSWWAGIVVSSVLLGVHFPFWSICFGKMVSVFYLTDTTAMMAQAGVVATIFVGLGITFLGASVVQGRGSGVIGESISRGLKKACYGSMLRQEAGWFDQENNNAYNLNRRLNTNTYIVQEATVKPLVFVIQTMATLISGVAISFAYNWKLALVGLAAVPFLVLLSMLQLRYVTWFAADEMRNFEHAGAICADAMTCIRTVQANGVEAAVVDSYAEVLVATQRVGLRRAVLSGVCYGAYYAMVCGAYALCFWYAATLEESGELTFENANIIIFAIVVSAIDSGKSLMRIVPSLAVAKEAQKDLFDCIDRIPRIEEEDLVEAAAKAERVAKEQKRMAAKKVVVAGASANVGVAAGNAIELPRPQNQHQQYPHQQHAHAHAHAHQQPRPAKVAFDNVHFNYPSRPTQGVLRGLNLTVRPGENVAVVGVSGSGKSTLLNMLQRLYDPNGGPRDDCGAVRLDGVDVRDVGVRALRNRVGVVPQEPSLIEGSIYQNITYGMDHPMEVPWAVVIAAAQKAGAAEFIMQLPFGYYTLLGAGGIFLSGGQAQRIAIARALVRNPEVLILDEATSALDNVSEAIVQRTLDAIQASRQYAVISIAHRLATVRGADRIHVVHRGRVVEAGTHGELMARGGRYAGLYMVETQTGEA